MLAKLIVLQGFCFVFVVCFCCFCFWCAVFALHFYAREWGNGLQLKVKRRDQPEAYLASVLDYTQGYDLALLSVQDEAFFEGLTPAVLGAEAPLRTPVIVAGCADNSPFSKILRFLLIVVLVHILSMPWHVDGACCACMRESSDCELHAPSGHGSQRSRLRQL